MGLLVGREVNKFPDPGGPGDDLQTAGRPYQQFIDSTLPLQIVLKGVAGRQGQENIDVGEAGVGIEEADPLSPGGRAMLRLVEMQVLPTPPLPLLMAITCACRASPPFSAESPVAGDGFCAAVSCRIGAEPVDLMILRRYLSCYSLKYSFDSLIY